MLFYYFLLVSERSQITWIDTWLENQSNENSILKELYLLGLTISTTDSSYNDVASFSSIPIYHCCLHFLSKRNW